MVNAYGIPLSHVFKERFIHFFSKNSDNWVYLLFHYIWIIVFFVPFFIESFVEFIVLTIIFLIGKIGESLFSAIHLSIIWLIPGLLFGLLYFIVGKIFFILFAIFTLPNFLVQKQNYN